MSPRPRAPGALARILGALALLASCMADEVTAQAVVDRRVALTFDDLPWAGAIGEAENETPRDEVGALNLRVLEALRQAGAPATGFVVERQAAALAEEGPVVLRRWTEGAFALGNHGFSHADINALDLAAIESEILLGEPSLRAAMTAAGKPVRFMRFPLNHTGRTADIRDGVQRVLGRLGYEAAASTIDTSDYVFEAAYAAALSRADHGCVARVRDAYLAHSAVQIDYYAALSAAVLGYGPPEIALLHLNRINADVLPDLIALYRERGYRFVTLEEAQADPAYRTPSRFVSAFGPMWAYRWAVDRGVRVEGALEQEPPDWVVDYAADGDGCGPDHG